MEAPSPSSFPGLSALDPMESNVLLSFLEHFAALAADPTAMVAWKWETMNVFEKQFVYASRRRIQEALSKLDLHLAVWKDSLAARYLLCTKGKAGAVLDASDLSALLSGLEENLAKPGVFDYVEIGQRTVEAAIKVLRGTRDYIGRSKIETTQVFPIVPEDPSVGLEVDEIGFATGGLFIVFPDANLFSQKHIELICEMSDQPRRIYRDWYYLVPLALLHECLHCVQNVRETLNDQSPAQQKDDELTYFWKLEHSASFGNLNLLSTVLKEVPDLFLEGWAEEAILSFFEFSWHIHQKLDKELLAGYATWRDSFALHPPVSMDSHEAARSDTHASATFYMKQRLALEAYDDGKTFIEFLDLHFQPGVVLDRVCEEPVPDKFHIKKEKDFNSLKSNPFNTAQSDSFLQGLPEIASKQ